MLDLPIDCYTEDITVNKLINILGKLPQDKLVKVKSSRGTVSEIEYIRESKHKNHKGSIVLGVRY